MSQLQFDNMTVASLETLLGKSYDKLLELELAADPDANAIELINTKITEIAGTIKSKTEKRQCR